MQRGRRDPARPGRQMRDGLAGLVTSTLIEGAPHASNITDPGAVNAAIVTFLRTLPG